MKLPNHPFWTIMTGLMPPPVYRAVKMHGLNQLECKDWHLIKDHAIADIPKDEPTFGIEHEETP